MLFPSKARIPNAEKNSVNFLSLFWFCLKDVFKLEFRGSRVSRYVGEMVLWIIGWGSQRNLEASRKCVTLQNDRKGCTLDYLYGLRHFRFDFGATEKHLEGMVITPLGGRGLKQSKMFGFYNSKPVGLRKSYHPDPETHFSFLSIFPLPNYVVFTITVYISIGNIVTLIIINCNTVIVTRPPTFVSFKCIFCEELAHLITNYPWGTQV